MNLNGQAILVSGGAKRIGAAIVRELAAAGARLIIHFNRSQDEARALAEEVGALGIVGADLTKKSAAEELFARASELAGGELRGIVNNASVYANENAARIHVEAAETLARALRRGSVVNLLDSRYRENVTGLEEYIASKRAAAEMTLRLARELAPEVAVNAVAPGAVIAEARLAAFNPLKTLGNPQGVAKAVRFLMEADFITGQIIFYDGGQHLRSEAFDAVQVECAPQAQIGVTAEERAEKQTVNAAVVIKHGGNAMIDYIRAKEIIAEVALAKPRELLETLADEIAAEIFKEFTDALVVNVTLGKPRFPGTSVEITRARK